MTPRLESVSVIPLRGAGKIVGRLELAKAARVLLVGVPEPLERLLAEAAPPDQSLVSTPAETLRAIKERFDLILLWQETRVGSRTALEAARKRLAEDGRLWIATAMKKVIGPRTPAVHRLERGDLVKAMEKEGMVLKGEARLSAWHVAYGFERKNL
jgi:hypothetical protein